MEILRQDLMEFRALHGDKFSYCTFDGNTKALRGLATPLAIGPMTMSGKRQPKRPQVLFCTVQTFCMKLAYEMEWKLITHFRNCVILQDEIHWAINASFGRKIRGFCTKAEAQLVGFTATPVKNDHQVVVHSTPFIDLVNDGILAKPIFSELRTQHTWTPTFNTFDIDQRSLKQLAAANSRNVVIVQRVGEVLKEGKFKKLIVFAIDINHARELNRLLQSHAIASRVIDSGLTAKEEEDALAAFRNDQVNVIVNVTKLAVGLNIPDIDCVSWRGQLAPQC